MSAPLTIEVSDELLNWLRQTAAAQGKTPETLAAECLGTHAPQHPSGSFRRWAGSWASNVPDASLRHDEYLGQNLHQELNEPRHD